MQAVAVLAHLGAAVIDDHDRQEVELDVGRAQALRVLRKPPDSAIGEVPGPFLFTMYGRGH
jgi:hypothetical protein